MQQNSESHACHSTVQVRHQDRTRTHPASLACPIWSQTCRSLRRRKQTRKLIDRVALSTRYKPMLARHDHLALVV